MDNNQNINNNNQFNNNNSNNFNTMNNTSNPEQNINQQTKILNVIPQINNSQNTNFNQMPSNINSNSINNSYGQNANEDFDALSNQAKSKYWSDAIELTDTSLSNLNVDDEYNNMGRIDYSQDPRVKKNLEETEKEKNTITITGEAKVFLIIILVLLLFVFIMPTIFDFLMTLG